MASHTILLLKLPLLLAVRCCWPSLLRSTLVSDRRRGSIRIGLIFIILELFNVSFYCTTLVRFFGCRCGGCGSFSSTQSGLFQFFLVNQWGQPHDGTLDGVIHPGFHDDDRFPSHQYWIVEVIVMRTCCCSSQPKVGLPIHSYRRTGVGTNIVLRCNIYCNTVISNMMYCNTAVCNTFVLQWHNCSDPLYVL